MHMSDGLISPVVGLSMYGITGIAIGYSINKVQQSLEQKILPLMGLLGAFVFAAQMINFSIPGTGSSGHLCGGLLLSILLRPHAGFLVISAILIIQALFFADGGILALGCNIWNIGFYQCFVGYYFYKLIVANKLSLKNITIASIISSVISLQLGAFSVVLETLLSGKTDLPFLPFLLLMQPIHLAIGIIEGLITSAVVFYFYKEKYFMYNLGYENNIKFSYNKIIIVLLIITLLTGGIFSLFASSNPDGLEWAIEKVVGENLANIKSKFHDITEFIQSKFAFMPDYSFKDGIELKGLTNYQTSIAGIIGSVITFLFTFIIGVSMYFFKRLIVKKNNT